ncbi:MAG: DUF6916 family protein [Roseiflexaceae bacterium]
MLDKLTSADFAPHLHETFLLSPGPWGQPHDPAAHGAPLALELIEVDDLGAEQAADPSMRRQFSLIFRQPAGAYLPQRIYSIEHPTLGRLDIFLVPIGPDRGGMRYQAVFT